MPPCPTSASIRYLPSSISPLRSCWSTSNSVFRRRVSGSEADVLDHAALVALESEPELLFDGGEDRWQIGLRLDGRHRVRRRVGEGEREIPPSGQTCLIDDFGLQVA